MGMPNISCNFRYLRILLIYMDLHGFSHWPPWCNTNMRLEGEMIREIYFMHYQAIRSVVSTVVTLGFAMLLSYFILLFGV